MNKIIRNSLIVLATASTATVGHAATQGTLGATSTGSFVIDVTLQDLVQISSLDDLSLGTYSGTGNATGSEAFCVYRNGTGQYTATVTGTYNAGAGTGFSVYSAGNTMAYTVTYNGNAILHGGTTITELGNTSVQDCGGLNVGNNATIGVTIPQATLQAAPTGTYTGTVTILISPV